jgi:hypothetical protein
MNDTITEMVYEQTLGLPGVFLTPQTPGDGNPNAALFVRQLK